MNTTHNISTTAQTSSTIAPTVGVFHYVDLDTGSDVVSINGVANRPSQVFGSGSNLWVWTQDGVYHAADWTNDIEDVTPLVKIELA